MSRSYRIGAVAILCAAVLAWGYGPAARNLERDHYDRGDAQVRRHLEGAEALLLGRDVSGLTLAQRTARERHIADLRAYRQRGVFPHNHVLPSRRTPVFVDEHGTRCAMAHLIERSGEAALVARIARSRNLARIRDLAGEKALVAWLDGNGLTLAEAARIQPAYEGERPSDNFVQGLTIASATLGAGLGTAGVALNASTATSPNRRNVRGLLGVACGLIGAGLGAPALADDDGALRTFGALDICVGLVSVGLGIRQLNATSDRHGPAASPAVWRDDNGTRRVALVVRF